jgi:hypothetical protein
MGDGLVFLKSLRASLFNKVFRINLNLDGSTSLDSTFKVQVPPKAKDDFHGKTGLGEGTSPLLTATWRI